MRMTTTWWRSFYFLLVFARVLFAFLPGYIHPDEFFQSQEVSAPSILSLQGLLPWEFQKDFPARSCINPFLTSGLPFLLLKYLSETLGVSVMSSATLLYAPRLFMVLLSFIVDKAAFQACAAVGFPSSRVLVLASCWPMLVMQGRPFSNSLEQVILAIACLVTLDRSSEKVKALRSSDNVKPPGSSENVRSLGRLVSGVQTLEREERKVARGERMWRCFALGCVTAVGVFVRFTFVLYVLPLGLFAVLEDGVIARLAGGKEVESDAQGVREGEGRVGLWVHGRGLRAMARSILGGLVGFVAVAFFIVVADSLYFGHACVRVGGKRLLGCLEEGILWWEIRDVQMMSWGEVGWKLMTEMGFEGGLVVTPWNSLRYNMKEENLALHGIHPRYLHAAVNLPMLFGPIALAGALTATTWLFCQLSIATSTGKSGVGKLPKSSVQPRETHAHAALAGCIALPLVVLSLAPHQEPRFLLPMAMPMCLLFGGVVSRNKWLTALWIFFNVTAVTFFGVLHQGGVTSSLHFLYHHTRSPYSLSPLLSTLSLTHGSSHASTATRPPHQFPSHSTSAHRERSPKFSEQTCQGGLDHLLMGENVFPGGLDSQQEVAQGSGSIECASACGGRGVFVDGRFVDLSVEVIFYHTYMPPRSLLALPLKGTSDDLPSHVKVTDIGGGSIDQLHAAILAPLSRGASPRSGTGTGNAPSEPSLRSLGEGEACNNRKDITELTSARSKTSSPASERSAWVLKLVVTPATTRLAGTVWSGFSNCSIKRPPEARFGQEKGEGVRFYGWEKENGDGLRGEGRGEEGERGEGASANGGKAGRENGGAGELGEAGMRSLERSGEGSCRDLKCPLTLSLLGSFGGHLSTEEMAEVMRGVGSGDWSALLELFRLNVYGILFPM